MPGTFYVDQEQTFKAVIFLSSAPRMAYGASDKQDTTKDGVPKWEIQVAATFEHFGRLENEVLKVNMISYTDPGEAIGLPQPVELVGFRVRVHPVEKRLDKNGVERITGGTASYQADGITALSAA
ncbi:hypothetical protein KV205_31480 [Streptomyces sp. SKN60]|uniref:hypothetical protein n=1 Tax=Streptomyces sp. SKN60 TaxID=2855506 RepID=UPI0022471E08|nr:hypothetical protein [Streptomyces sp. SKN60]MCX2185011.1 hypothetical protein [Streptomyces sp. SKN60]